MTIKMLRVPKSSGGLYPANSASHTIENDDSFCKAMEFVCMELFENPAARRYLEQHNVSLTFDGITWKAQCTICPEWPCVCTDRYTRMPLLMIALYTDILLRPIFDRHNIAVEL